MYETSDFRNGLKIIYDNSPYEIVEFQHVKPGKGNAFTRTKIRHLLTGRVIDPTFKSGDKVGRPDMEEKVMQYLFREDDHFTFMDPITYDQVLVDGSAIGVGIKWLVENCNCHILFWDGRAIGVQLPAHLVFKIVECEPGIRGDTATGTTKPAKLESGVIVQVPLFVNEGESIRVDTREGKYIERA